MTRYPERQPAPLGAGDRLAGALAFALHRLAGQRLAPAVALHERAHAKAAALRGQALAGRLAPLRYRLRTGRERDAAFEDCCALFCAALPPSAAREVDAVALAAAARLAAGGIVAVADGAARRRAIELAAFTAALEHDGVHVLCVDGADATARADALRPTLGALGLEVGVVGPASDPAARRAAYRSPLVCVPLREAALDYLRDRVRAGTRPGALAGALARLDGDAPALDELALRGLRCAIVADAPVVMLDDALVPVAIARDVEVPEERLLYDQAMELARALREGDDFAFDAGRAALTPQASALLGRLVTPLGGVWAREAARERLVGFALEALHLLRRDVDYRVEHGRVLFPPRPPQEAEGAEEEDAMLLKFVEVKEGCAFSARRELVTRISPPAFLMRYLRLAGACRTARGLAHEFRSLYGLRTFVAGTPTATPAAPRRLFVDAAAKRAAWLALLRSRPSLVLAVRTQAAETALREALAANGCADVAVSLAPAERCAQPAERSGALVLELHESRRQVASILEAYGKDAADGAVLLALDEEAVSRHLGPALRTLARLRAGPDGEVAPAVAEWIVARVERRAEAAAATLRQELAARDQYLRDALAFSGDAE